MTALELAAAISNHAEQVRGNIAAAIMGTIGAALAAFALADAHRARKDRT